MDAIFAAWNAPVAEKSLASFEDLFDGFEAWAKAVQEQQRKYRTSEDYNVFEFGNLQLLMSAKPGGRPDIRMMCEVPQLCEWLLRWPEKVTWNQIRECLQRTHFGQALRMPKLKDDDFWLTLSAKGLHSLRSKIIFIKAYANRVQHRVTLLNPEHMATVASLVREMNWVEMKEPPFANAHRLPDPKPGAVTAGGLLCLEDVPATELAKAEDAAPTTSPAAPATNPAKAEPAKAKDAAPTTPPAAPAAEPGPAKAKDAPPTASQAAPAAKPAATDAAPATVMDPAPCEDSIGSPELSHKMKSIFTAMGIPLMFASPIGILEGEMPKSLQQKKRQLDEETPEVHRAKSRPIHKGAATNHFAKDKRTPPKKKAPSKSKKTSKAKKAKKKRKGANAINRGDGDDVVQVRYVSAKNPPRSYATAWRENKWKHIITVAEHEHGKHSEIVQDVGERLRSGKLTYDEARQQKKTLISEWPQ